MPPHRESGGIPQGSTRFSLSVKSEQPDAGRDDRNCLARHILGRKRGQGNIHFHYSAYHEQDLATLPSPGDLYSAIVCDDHIYIHVYTIGSVPSLSGRTIAHRWRSLSRVRRHRTSSPQGSSSNNGCCLCITIDQLMCASFFPQLAV